MDQSPQNSPQKETVMPGSYYERDVTRLTCRVIETENRSRHNHTIPHHVENIFRSQSPQFHEHRGAAPGAVAFFFCLFEIRPPVVLLRTNGIGLSPDNKTLLWRERCPRARYRPVPGPSQPRGRCQGGGGGSDPNGMSIDTIRRIRSSKSRVFFGIFLPSGSCGNGMRINSGIGRPFVHILKLTLQFRV